MSSVAIDVRALSKSFRTGWFSAEHVALRPVDFQVGRGECLAILGHNGAGKSTLLQLLAGLSRPSGGEVAIFGLPPSAWEVKREVGYLPERPALPARMSGREFLEECGRLSGLDETALERSIGSLVERFSLQEAVLRPIGWLSAGTRQRLALAQALIHAPRVLLLDEPLTGLDPHSRDRVVQSLRDLRSAGTTLLVATHHFGEWSTVCDRVAVVQAGQFRILGSTSQVLAQVPVRVQYRRADGTDGDPLSVALGTKIPSPDGVFARDTEPRDRDRLVDGVRSGGGEVLRVEPRAAALIKDAP